MEAAMKSFTAVAELKPNLHSEPNSTRSKLLSRTDLAALLRTYWRQPVKQAPSLLEKVTFTLPSPESAWILFEMIKLIAWALVSNALRTTTFVADWREGTRSQSDSEARS